MKDRNLSVKRETYPKTDKVFHFVLKSDLADIEKLSELVCEIADYLQLDKKEIYDLHLVMVEAVTNAIVHGNKLDGEKSVHVTCRITEDGLLLEVEDQGNGFDPTVIPSPLDAENLLKVTGRGIFLMKQIAQNVSYRFSTHGTALQIVLNRKKKQNQTE